MSRTYLCRTEMVPRPCHVVEMYYNNKLVGAIALDSKQEAEQFIETLSERLPKYKFGLKEEMRDKPVCIECGRP